MLLSSVLTPRQDTAPGAKPPGIFLLALGVVLPLVTLGVELAMRLNTQVFFDPLPSVAHVLMVALVPLANLAVWIAARKENTTHLRRLAWANGLAAGIALLYSILFLPLLPIAVIGIVWFGLGLLPLTPLLSLIATLRLRVHLRRLARAAHPPLRLWPGLLLGLGLLLVCDAPATLTRFGMRMVTAESVQTRASGMRLLRAVGSKDLLLRLCYVRSGATTDMLSFVFDIERTISTDEARKIYYRVTGESFNAVPPPRAARRGGWFDGRAEQGDAAVGGRVQGLSLIASRLDGSLDGNAALGYVEWTMVFKNTAPLQHEARAQIALPPGAVVSRLTLWIEGEEREAAFAGRNTVRQAYQSVVRRNRDPVLVTTAGQDRILLQLFPVPPGGEMKVRVGMTVPLGLNNAYEGVLHLPYFQQRNFDVPEHSRHALWMEAKRPLRSSLASTAHMDDKFTMHAELDDARLSLATSTLAVERDEHVGAWTIDSKDADYLVRQTESERTSTAPRRLVIVMDGSVAMRDAVPRIAAALADLPKDIDLKLIMAHDAMTDDPVHAGLRAATLAEAVKKFRYVGGHDNTAALARGLDAAMEMENSALLWIHGPQPALLTTQEALLQRLERIEHLPAWYDLQIQPGANLIGEQLESTVALIPLREEELQPLVAGWTRGARQVVMQRERIKKTDAGALLAGEQTSDHLARLWARDEITRLRLTHQAQPRQEAVALAQRYQLVTPVSGAVVLETQAQYNAAGLEPVPPGTVPTIPEPETWALIVIVAFVLAYFYRRRRAAAAIPHAV